MTCQVSSNFKITFRDSSVTDDPCTATVLPATCQGHQFLFLLCGQKALLAEPLILGNDPCYHQKLGHYYSEGQVLVDVTILGLSSLWRKERALNRGE